MASIETSISIVSGSAIFLTATAFFLLAFLFNPRQGVLRRRAPAVTAASPQES